MMIRLIMRAARLKKWLRSCQSTGQVIDSVPSAMLSTLM